MPVCIKVASKSQLKSTLLTDAYYLRDITSFTMSAAIIKLICVLVLAVVSVSCSETDKLKCSVAPANISESWMDMQDRCIDAMKLQVQNETQAAMTYLAMGAYFGQDSINLPGFSKFFFEHANEEREHAIKIIEYLLMRGQLTSDIKSILNFALAPHDIIWSSGSEALKQALELEAGVTRSLLKINEECEKNDDFNDYHLVDYLTNDFLDEQYKGQRDLAGKITVLDRLKLTHKGFGEFIFDKKLLKGEL